MRYYVTMSTHTKMLNEDNMSRIIMTAPEIRAELARRGITRRQLSTALDISYSYTLKILQGRRDALEQRGKITKYLEVSS